MTGLAIAFGAGILLLLFVLSIALAQAAAYGDRVLRRQVVAAERERPKRGEQPMRRAA